LEEEGQQVCEVGWEKTRFKKKGELQDLHGSQKNNPGKKEKRDGASCFMPGIQNLLCAIFSNCGFSKNQLPDLSHDAGHMLRALGTGTQRQHDQQNSLPSQS